MVTFDGDFMALAYVRETQLKWPLLLDETQALYTAYGMTRAHWWALYGPSAIWKYLVLIFSGTRPGKPGKDWRQLGGDILIDPAGIVRMHHKSTGPHDRPSVDMILRVVDDHPPVS